jgi:hypothetical protein
LLSSSKVSVSMPMLSLSIAALSPPGSMPKKHWKEPPENATTSKQKKSSWRSPCPEFCWTEQHPSQWIVISHLKPLGHGTKRKHSSSAFQLGQKLINGYRKAHELVGGVSLPHDPPAVKHAYPAQMGLQVAPFSLEICTKSIFHKSTTNWLVQNQQARQSKTRTGFSLKTHVKLFTSSQEEHSIWLD